MLCRSCYHQIPEGSAFCPRCGARQSDAAAGAGGAGQAPPERPGLPPGQPPGRHANPWEDREGRSAFAAFGETLQQSLFHPAAFFRKTSPDRGVGAAFLYAVIVGTVALAVAMLWQQAIGRQLGWDGEGRFMALLRPTFRVVGLAFLPFGIALGNLIWAAVLHVALLILGGARGGYGTTLKAVCYSSSATAFNVFPVCGAAIGAVWQAYALVIGMRELHRTTTTRAFWAWFLPFVVAACLAGLAAVAMIAGLTKFLHGLGGPIDL